MPRYRLHGRIVAHRSAGDGTDDRWPTPIKGLALGGAIHEATSTIVHGSCGSRGPRDDRGGMRGRGQSDGHTRPDSDAAAYSDPHIGNAADAAAHANPHIGNAADAAAHGDPHIGNAADAAAHGDPHIGSAADTAAHANPAADGDAATDGGRQARWHVGPPLTRRPRQGGPIDGEVHHLLGRLGSPRL